MKKIIITYLILLPAAMVCAAQLPVLNGEFDQGTQFRGVYQFPEGWDDYYGDINRVHYNPQGSMDDPLAQYQATESHIRFGWADGCAIFQDESISGVTLNVIEADTVYTMIARVRLDEDSPTVGVGLKLVDPNNGVIIEQDFFDTGLDWETYMISFDSGDPAYSGFVGGKLSPVVVLNEFNHWLMVDYVRLFSGDFATISDQPEDTMVPEGEDAVFTVAISPQESASYQWKRSDDLVYEPNDVNVGTDSNVLTIPSVGISDAGMYYYCEVTVLGSVLTSEMALLEVPRLMGHWAFDNNLLDSSVYGWDGSAVSPSYGGGINGNAVNFDGTIGQEVEIQGSEDAFNNFTLGLSVSCWIKAVSQDGWIVIAGKSLSAQNGWELGINANTDGPFLGVRGRDALSSEMSIEDNQWHHVVGTWDGTSGEYRLYIDGELNLEGIDDGAAVKVDSPLMFGVRNEDGKEYPYEGLLDDLKIYNYSISAEQVLDIYNALADPDKTLCISEYTEVWDVSGPSGEPDCTVDEYDMIVFMENWLEDNVYPPTN